MIGEKLGSFRIEGTLGVGAMGVVYKATNETTGRTAAVKVVSSDAAQRGRAYDRFQREAEILQQFRHPNIVRFLAVGRYKGTSYFAMEFIPGQTLEQWLADRGPLPWKEVVPLAIQVCDALHYAHEHGVVHRDLKPSNLMVTEAGVVKLTDFGIAKDLDATALTATGRTLGTAAYMAPEQIRGTPEVSHKTDLYALGIVLYQMLTGVPPFEGASAVVLMHCHLNEPVPRASAKLSEIPKALDDLVAQLMAKAPADRPWDAVAAGEVLRKIQEKISRGETVGMVWSNGAGSAAGAGDAAKKSAKKGGKTRGALATVGVDDSDRRRRLLETAGMGGALLLIASFVGYMLWPPSARYLFTQAERLMATGRRSEMADARDTYLEPLDRRFPENPYKKTTRQWRDQILLASVEGRARTLQSPVATPLTEPKSPEEEKFVQSYTLVAAAAKRHDDPAAVAAWRELASMYHGDEPQERPWLLLAEKRAGEAQRSIDQRRAAVGQLLTEAKLAEQAGDHAKAASILVEAKSRYGQYPELADLWGPPEPGPESKGNPAGR